MKIHKVTINNQAVFVSEGRLGFNIVKPWKNEDGSINWFNFLTGGSWWNLILTAIIVIVVLGTLYEYSNNIQTLLDCFEIPGRLQVCIDKFTPENLKLIK